MFVHSVYFWLRDDLSPTEVTSFEAGLQSLVSINGVKNGSWGVPAATRRPVIDHTYSYALVLVFDDEAAHDAYQVDPVHRAFVEGCSPFWRTLRIYDAETPRR